MEKQIYRASGMEDSAIIVSEQALAFDAYRLHLQFLYGDKVSLSLLGRAAINWLDDTVIRTSPSGESVEAVAIIEADLMLKTKISFLELVATASEKIHESFYENEFKLGDEGFVKNFFLHSMAENITIDLFPNYKEEGSQSFKHYSKQLKVYLSNGDFCLLHYDAKQVLDYQLWSLGRSKGVS